MTEFTSSESHVFDGKPAVLTITDFLTWMDCGSVGQGTRSAIVGVFLATRTPEEKERIQIMPPAEIIGLAMKWFQKGVYSIKEVGQLATQLLNEVQAAQAKPAEEKAKKKDRRIAPAAG